MSYGAIDAYGGIASALGSAADEFADLEMGALESVLGDSELSSQLSPLVQATGGIFALAGDYAALADGVSSAEAAQTAIQLGTRTLEMVAQAVGGAAGAGLAGLIPVVGMILGAAFSNDYAGLSPEEAEQNAAANCRLQFLPIRGTGPGGVVYPADVFVYELGTSGTANPHGDAPWSGPGYVRRTSIGRALVAIESVGTGKLLYYYRLAGEQRGVSGLAKLGIPQSTLAALAHLRAVVETSILSGADAAIPWMLYLDLLREQFKSGRMTPNLADFLSTYAESTRMGTEATHKYALLEAFLVLPRGHLPDDREGMSIGTCRRFGRPALDGVLRLLHDWELTVEPRWNADKLKLAEMLAEARKSLDRLTRVQLLASALRHRPRLGPIDLSRPRLGPIDLSD